MSEQNQQDWSNYWQGRTAEQVGDAMVGVGIERSTELAAFWEGTLAGLGKNDPLLDLACGAGSVLRHAHKLGVGKLTGIDISPDAIAAMQKAIPGAQGVVGPVNDMPFEDDQFAMVVSQFGFEYAGSEQNVLATAAEIARILKPGGKFVALCHAKDGGIEQEVTGHLGSIADLERTGFMKAAKNMFEAVFTLEAEPNEAHNAAFRDATAALTAPREQIVAWLQTGLTPDDQIRLLGQHLYTGAMDLYNRRKAYALSDVIGWLDGMQSEIDAYKGRMHSMQAAALGAEQCDAILSVLENAGYKTASPETLHLGGDPKPAAWILKAG